MKTLVVGVSAGTDRYANRAVRRLRVAGHEVVALGLHAGETDGVPILTGTPAIDGLDTVSLYLNPVRQAPLADYLLSLRPRRIIFNPGAENPSLMVRAQAAGIDAVQACTLVLVATGQF